MGPSGPSGLETPVDPVVGQAAASSALQVDEPFAEVDVLTLAIVRPGRGPRAAKGHVRRRDQAGVGVEEQRRGLRAG